MQTYFIKDRIAHFYSSSKLNVSLRGFKTYYFMGNHSIEMVASGLVDRVIDIPFVLNGLVANLELTFSNKSMDTFTLNGDMAQQFNESFDEEMTEADYWNGDVPNGED